MHWTGTIRKKLYEVLTVVNSRSIAIMRWPKSTDASEIPKVSNWRSPTMKKSSRSVRTRI